MDLGNINDMSAMSELLQTSDNKLVVKLDIDKIRCEAQVRTETNEGFSQESLDDLAASIKANGLLQPVTVRPDPENADHYIILWGERRFRASQLAGLPKIDAIIRDDLTDPKDVALVQFLENEQRADLNTFEKAAALQKMIDSGLKKGEIADRLGLQASKVTYILGCYNLPQYIIDLYHSGNLSDSPRLLQEFRKLYETNPAKVSEIISEMLSESTDSETPRQITRTDLQLIRDMLAGRDQINLNQNSGSDADNSSESESDFSEQDNESETESDNSDDSSDYNEAEYPDKEEREHSAAPKMASAHQENSEHTAGLGKPDFTDRDTRAEHDLSDRLPDDDPSDISDSDEDDHEIEDALDNDDEPEICSGFEVEYQGMTYAFNLEAGSDKEHVLITDSEGASQNVLLSELKFIKTIL